MDILAVTPALLYIKPNMRIQMRLILMLNDLQVTWGWVGALLNAYYELPQENVYLYEGGVFGQKPQTHKNTVWF